MFNKILNSLICFYKKKTFQQSPNNPSANGQTKCDTVHKTVYNADNRL